MRSKPESVDPVVPLPMVRATQHVAGHLTHHH